MEDDQETNPPLIYWRPDRTWWGVAGVFGLFGLMPLYFWLTPSKLDDRIAMSLMGAGLVIPALLLAVWLLRAQINADENGLRWRGLGRWQSAAWGDITDYYDKLLPKKGVTTTLEIGKQKIQISKSYWKENPAFRNLVVQKATQARATTWGVWGGRPELDWPRVFGYKSGDNRFIAFGFPCFGLVLLVWAVTRIPRIVGAFTTTGWQWGLASVGAFCLGVGPLLLYLLPLQLTARNLRRRWRQRITVDRDGLTFDADERQVRATWGEVSDFFVAPRVGFNISPTYAVVTKNGALDFSGAIGDVGVLMKSIMDNSTSVGATKWRSTDTDVLGGPASRWTSGCEGVGERVYHYRTRTNRALMWFPTALAAMPVLMISLSSQGLAPKPNWGFVAFVLGIAFWGWWRYFTASIQTDGVGITQHTIWGRRFLRWDQIERFSKSGGDAYVFGNVVGAGTRIRFWMGIADVEELKDEITRRATYSRNKTWDEEADQDTKAAIVAKQP